MADNDLQDAYDTILAAHNVLEEAVESVGLREKSNAKDIETVVKTVDRIIGWMTLLEKHINGEIVGPIPPFKKEGD